MLLDGTYTESLISPAGVENVTVQAANAGAVLLDGEGVRVPVYIDQSEWALTGLNACNSSGQVYDIRGDNVALAECIGWDAANINNSHVFTVSEGTGITLTDCAGFGVGRKTISVSSYADTVTCTRCFAIWEGYESAGPSMPFTVAYRTHNCTWDHCIAMRNRRFGAAPVSPYGLFATDGGYADADDDDTNNTLQNSLALLRADDVLDADQVVLIVDVDHFTVNNCAFVMIGHPTEPRTCILATANPTQTSNTATDVTVIGPNANNAAGDMTAPGLWSFTNILLADTLAEAYSEGVSIWNAVSGAQLDAAVFLAWPMNQRIIDAMTAAGYDAADVIDVVAELTAAFGAAP